jgi:DNA-binding NarL/FixJ family response regulator
VVGLDALRAAGLQALFEKNTGIDVVMEDISSLQASLQGPDAVFNLAVVGANAGPDIFSVIASLRSAHPELPIIVMSHASGQEAILRVLMLGAKGFLHEASTPGPDPSFVDDARVAARGPGKRGQLYHPGAAGSESVARWQFQSRDCEKPQD